MTFLSLDTAICTQPSANLVADPKPLGMVQRDQRMISSIYPYIASTLLISALQTELSTTISSVSTTVMAPKQMSSLSLLDIPSSYGWFDNTFYDVASVAKYYHIYRQHETNSQLLINFLHSFTSQTSHYANVDQGANIDLALRCWQDLCSYFRAKGVFLDVPDAGVTEHGNVILSWSKNEYYLEYEVGEGESSFFGLNRNTGKSFMHDYSGIHDLNQDIAEMLFSFIKA